MKEYIQRAVAVQELEVLRQEYEMHDDCDELVARRCRDALSAVPAADVAEVRHGRWIVHFDHFAPYQKCSVCGFEIPLVATENEGGMCLYKHCPECTACMDKEDEHEAN